MAPEYTTQSNPQSAILHTLNRPASQSRVRTRRLWEAVAKIAAIEFLAVSAAAYSASFAYHYAGSGSLPPTYQYVPAAFFIAVLVSIFSISFRHFEGVQTQPRHR